MNFHASCSWLCRLALALLPGLWTAAVAQSGTAAIQAQEARRSDERLLAHLEGFRRGLQARYGSEVLLAMLQFGENEVAALVLRGETTEFVLWQGGRWTDDATHRRLEPWARPEQARSHAFAPVLVDGRAIRRWLAAWRAGPGQAADFVGQYQVGFDPALGRVVVQAQVGSMTRFGLSRQYFDPLTGAAIASAPAAAPAPRPPVSLPKSEDLRQDLRPALAALRGREPAARLGRLRLAAGEIEIVLADRRVFGFDTAHVLHERPPYEGEFLCEEGWREDQVDWSALAGLPRNGVLAASLDEEDARHARYLVDRSPDCGELTVRVIYDNYRAPQPWVEFDPQGRLLRSWR